jgi:Asp-tRNA(Asn)/Glu-tRNA(Gln) amidotransferase A subunit family amidase
LLSQKRISPLELAEEHIRQIYKLNGKLNALVDFDPDRVRAQARVLEATTSVRGPLYGLPMTMKSSIAVAGYRCETGSLLNKSHIPDRDAVITRRMRDAGAIILGTTNCPEFLMAYMTDNRLYGRTSNPWDLDRTPGGSSGGEAAAIAAGLSAGGFGSDGGGSVREPAHFTGICALKPTPGRVPAEGHLPPCAGPFGVLGAVGPMGRTTADVTLFFKSLSGHHHSDPFGAPVSYRQYSKNDLLPIKIGFFEDDGLVPVTQESRETLQAAVESLRSQGFNVEHFRPRALEEARQLWWKMFVRSGAMLFTPIVKGKEELLSPLFMEFLAIANSEPPLTGDEVLQMWTECDRIRELLLEEMRECPVLLSPVCSLPAFRHSERSWTIDGRQVAYLDAMRYTQWSNVLAAPAAVVPVGRSREGLPIGIQIAGRPYEDEVVLAIAGYLEHDFGYIAPSLNWTKSVV